MAYERPHDVLMIGESAVIRTVRERIERFAPWPDPVLVSGETGTGKELVARALHVRSGRRAGPFLAVNCAATSAQLFESECFGHERGSYTDAHSATPGWFGAAEGGVLFLDEIGELPLALQAKLLRVIEGREIQRVGAATPHSVDVRVVAATNVDLAGQAAVRGFRRDLYHRLKVLTIDLPPVRERGAGDVSLLIDYYIRAIATERHLEDVAVSPEAMSALMTYPWPGNVRELVNVLRGAVAIANSSVIDLQHLPPEVQSPCRVDDCAEFRERRDAGDLDLPASVRAVELDLLKKALARTGGRQKEAASLVHVPERTFRRKVVRYGLTRAIGRHRDRAS